ncbi:hypothetical protein NEMBOFW57_007555 [Staphylotrichum longicolle]|uniref:Uncharacterized protein n=1 Tax=Staphylotrichum longicolle TaxID=669026 RepID=A0AAD4EVP9_9PEZI|nr:hypothetical protein NEMBOFW57_007555 [Staphylotrichum longicolle]
MTLGDDEPATGEDVLTPDNNESAQHESFLARELADLRALQNQLAVLAKEVHARERWLAEAVGAATPSGIADCDGVVCVVRTILRKTKYAAQGAVYSNNDETNEPPLDRTIPLPPWRRPNTNNTDPSSPPGSEPSDADGAAGDDDSFNPFGPEVLVLVAFNIIFFVGFSLIRALFPLRIAANPESLHRQACALEREVSAHEWQEFEEEQAARYGGSCFPSSGWWGGQGRREVDLGDEERVQLGAGEECWDEKEGYVDEKMPQADEVGGGYESDSDEELRVLGEEISSFRSALALVEDLVAAEDERTEERGR